MLGATVVVLKGSWQALIDMALVRGDLLMIAAVILYALYSVLLLKRPNIHPLSVLVYTFGLGAVGLLPLYLWEISVVGGFALTPGVAGSIAYVALFPLDCGLFLLEPRCGRHRGQPHRPVHQPDSRFRGRSGHRFSGRNVETVPSGGHGADRGGVRPVQPLMASRKSLSRQWSA